MLDIRQLPTVPCSELKDGDLLVEIASPNNFYGRLAIRTGYADALKKGVPVCQHTLMVASKNGQRTQIEAIWRVTESPFKAQGDQYVVVRPASASPDQIAAAIAWSRAKLGEPYGYENVLKLGLHAYWPWLPLRANDKDPLVCSQLGSEAYEEGARYKDWGERDAQLTPWDYLTSVMQPEFVILGRLQR